MLSGGGNKGAYQAGVLFHLLQDRRTHYDIICGVSVGALNGAYLAMYARGEEGRAAEGLRELWTTITPDDVYKHWPLGLLQGLWKSSFFNSSPLRSLISRTLDLGAIRNARRQLRVGATCISSGSYQVFDQNCDYIVDAVKASAAFPGAFEPVALPAGGIWMDGGVRETTPIGAAVSAGATSIDVIVTSPGYSAPFHAKKPRALEMMVRAVEVMSDEVLANDLEVTKRINQLVQTGRAQGMREISLQVIRPASPLVHDLLDFRTSTCAQLFARGHNEALQTLRGNLLPDRA